MSYVVNKKINVANKKKAYNFTGSFANVSKSSVFRLIT